jgi:colanic acid biosynthesis glycosyl transferase WcaI
MVGIMHPSKVYTAMAVQRPLLYIGPKPSHISDLLEQSDFGWRVAHGDVEGVVAILASARSRRAELRERGRRAFELLERDFRQEYWCGEFCDALEAMTAGSNERRGE